MLTSRLASDFCITDSRRAMQRHNPYSVSKATTELSSEPTWSPESRRRWEGDIQGLAKTLLSAGKNGRSSGPVSPDGSPP